VTWRVFVRAAAEVDLEALDAADQLVLSEELFRWVSVGPPRKTPRQVFGVGMFDDDMAGAFRVTYVVDDGEQNILIIRIRKTPSPL
jgi:mRNA-degrading endonuclease RelE of RelBE toxin-antitoxin system